MSARATKSAGGNRLHHVLRVGFQHKQISSAARAPDYYTPWGDEDDSRVMEDAEQGEEDEDDGVDMMEEDDEGQKFFSSYLKMLLEAAEQPVTALEFVGDAEAMYTSAQSLLDPADYNLEAARKLAYIVYFHEMATVVHQQGDVVWNEANKDAQIFVDSILQDLAEACYDVKLYDPITENKWDNALFRAPSGFTTADYDRTLTLEDYKLFVRQTFLDFNSKTQHKLSLPEPAPLRSGYEASLFQGLEDVFYDLRTAYDTIRGMMFVCNCPAAGQTAIVDQATKILKDTDTEISDFFVSSFNKRVVKSYLDAVSETHLNTYVFLLSPVDDRRRMGTWRTYVDAALRKRGIIESNQRVEKPARRKLQTKLSRER